MINCNALVLIDYYKNRTHGAVGNGEGITGKSVTEKVFYFASWCLDSETLHSALPINWDKAISVVMHYSPIVELMMVKCCRWESKIIHRQYPGIATLLLSNVLYLD